MTGTRTHVAWMGSSGSSMIFRVSSRNFDSSSNSSPSNSQSIRRSWSAWGSFRSRSIDCAPAPDTDWYVATRTRTRPAASCNGFRTAVNGIVQQFGFATIPSCSRARAGFTSGTTSGMPGSSRYAEDLSIASAPPLTACGTSSRDAPVPTEKRKTSTSPRASASGVASSTVYGPTCLPAERADAKTRTCWNPRACRSSSVMLPTAPVAPTTPMRALCKVEGIVEGANGSVDLVRLDVTGDLDRRGRDDGRRDSRRLEGGERLRGDARVALHAGADHRDLAEVVLRLPAGAEPVERARS